MATRRSGRSGRSPLPRVSAEPAYVLHSYPWSESSLVIDLFTRGHGRVAVVAKGAKRPYSQLRGVLLPFQRLLASYTVGESEVHNLRGADWGGGAAMLTGAALLTGFYLNELLMKLLARDDAHPALFDAYAQTLPTLALADDTAVQAALRAFELTLLRGIGVLPELGAETLTQRPVLPAQAYRLEGEAGVVRAHGGRPDGLLRGETLLALEAALGGESLAALQQACATALPELKSALRGVLHYHLGSPQLRTRQLMMELTQK